MKHHRFAVAVLWAASVAVPLGLTGAGCGPEVPAEPTWSRDIYPILESRCLRCHSSPPKTDPAIGLKPDGTPRIPLGSYDVPEFASFGLMAGLLVKSAPGLVKATDSTRMPPEPYEELEDWQIETFEKWAAADFPP